MKSIIRSLALFLALSFSFLILMTSCNDATTSADTGNSFPVENEVSYELPDTSTPPEAFDLSDYSDAVEDEKKSGNLYYQAEETTLARSVFAGNTRITSVYLADGITAIESGAFSGCTALKTVRLPATLQKLGSDGNGKVFAGCTSLEAVYVPEGVTTVETETFSGCTALTIVSLPSTLGTIASKAFSDCLALQALALPDGLMFLGKDAFLNTGITVLSLPDNLNVNWALHVKAVFVTKDSAAHTSTAKSDPSVAIRFK